MLLSNKASLQTECKIQWVKSSGSLPTIPARMTLWFLKPSRDVSKRNPLEDVHVTTEAETNVLALHHPSLCVHHPELQELSTSPPKILRESNFFAPMAFSRLHLGLISQFQFGMFYSKLTCLNQTIMSYSNSKSALILILQKDIVTETYRLSFLYHILSQ